MIVTNIEKIRAMTDGQIALALLHGTDCGFSIPFCKDDPACIEMMDRDETIPDDMCIQCVMRWLHQEAKDGDLI